MPGIGYYAQCKDTEGDPIGLYQPHRNSERRLNHARSHPLVAARLQRRSLSHTSRRRQQLADRRAEISDEQIKERLSQSRAYTLIILHTTPTTFHRSRPSHNLGARLAQHGTAGGGSSLNRLPGHRPERRRRHLHLRRLAGGGTRDHRGRPRRSSRRTHLRASPDPRVSGRLAPRVTPPSLVVCARLRNRGGHAPRVRQRPTSPPSPRRGVGRRTVLPRRGAAGG